VRTRAQRSPLDDASLVALGPHVGFVREERRARGDSDPSGDRPSGDVATPPCTDGWPRGLRRSIHEASVERGAPLEGEDFIAQATALFRVAACGDWEDAPAQFDKDVIAHHCADLERAYADYRRDWVEVAEPFLASFASKDLPAVVVYPFGGGDLTSALTTFPDAAEITTISLEPAGDVRPIDRLARERLAGELAVHRSHIERLFAKAHSRTDNLDKEAHTELPGEILFALGALVVHGAEPVSLRYFRLRADGSLAFVSQADIAAAGRNPKALHRLFENVELRFRRSERRGKPRPDAAAYRVQSRRRASSGRTRPCWRTWTARARLPR